MNRMLTLALLAPVALAAPMTGVPGGITQDVLSAIGAKSAPCQDPGLNVPSILAACATFPGDSATFRRAWTTKGHTVAQKTMTLQRGWTADTDPAYKGAFYRTYRFAGQPFLVYYQPKGSSGLLTFSYPNTTRSYKNCTEVRAAGMAPLRRGQAGYSTDLDRDGDGIACEK